MDTYDIAMRISETIEELEQLHLNLQFDDYNRHFNRIQRMIGQLDTLYQELWRENPGIPVKSYTLRGDMRIWVE